ncbi:hypothetical protein QQ045_025705 [Rhodiola kirilowii]
MDGMDSQSQIGILQGVEFRSNIEELGYIPKLGMDFNSVEDAWEFWVEFGARTGFTPRKFYSHVSKVDQLPSNVVYVCNKEGKGKEDSGLETRKRGRVETRTNCEVRFGIHRTPTTFGKYRIYRLCLDHNHSLHTSDTIHISEIQYIKEEE